MQNASMAFKVKVLFDGEEVPGLVRFGEVPLEKSVIEIPGFQRITKIQTGVKTIPEVAMTYETRRNSKTRKFFQDYFTENQVKDVTVIYCDASGAEFARDLWQSVECRKFSTPEVDFSSISYARVDVILLPYDIIPV